MESDLKVSESLRRALWNAAQPMQYWGDRGTRDRTREYSRFTAEPRTSRVGQRQRGSAGGQLSLDRAENNFLASASKN
ncbi:hypothetical protein BB934_14195 [Microvirga ossetica]|uniref:Uncharacterized protein n=1 Tax=Microvirga ossetica TaxID=1882682 RepID=A0A1B2EGW0_9HYPH|nr:hypothetical protein BB934_14195 [Microvirga ossetica]